jgi:solute carrier family 25 citrate transporter 1
MINGISQIIKEEGIAGIYRGMSSVIARQGANSAVRMSSYGVIKVNISIIIGFCS